MKNKLPVRIGFAPPFLKALKHLQKKYRNIRNDLQTLTDVLQEGETPGDQIPGTHYTVFKVRIKNSDVAKGKSGGYRVIYYLKTAEWVVLISLYAKTEQSDISPEIIKQIIDSYAPPDDD